MVNSVYSSLQTGWAAAASSRSMKVPGSLGESLACFFLAFSGRTLMVLPRDRDVIQFSDDEVMAWSLSDDAFVPLPCACAFEIMM